MLELIGLIKELDKAKERIHEAHKKINDIADELDIWSYTIRIILGDIENKGVTRDFFFEIEDDVIKMKNYISEIDDIILSLREKESEYEYE